jgi:hypothetical protein
MTSFIKEKVLKVLCADLLAGVGIFVLTALVCVPSTGAVGFGCLMGGLISGGLLGPMIVRLIHNPEALKAKVAELQATMEQATKKSIEQATERMRLEEKLASVEKENCLLRNGAIHVTDLTPIFELMLLKLDLKVFDPREFQVNEKGGLVYRGLLTIDVPAKLGVDFSNLKFVEDGNRILVSGFQRLVNFEHLGDESFSFQEIREKNSVLPGDWTAHLKHEEMADCAEKHRRELKARVNQKKLAEFVGMDSHLKSASKELIRVLFKNTTKIIEFVEGDAPLNALPLASRFSSIDGRKRLSL